MKGFKKVLTGILAGAMALSMTFTAGTAMKANAATVKINRDASTQKADVDQEAVDAQSYTIYKIFSAEAADNGETMYYVTDAAQKTALETIGFSFSEVNVTLGDGEEATVETRYIAYIDTEDLDGDELAKKMQSLTLNGTFEAVKVTVEGKETTTIPADMAVDGIEVEDGYYVVVSAVGTKLLANTFVNGGTVTEKNVYPTLDKQQRIDRGQATADDYTDDLLVVKVGDIIDYTIDVTVPYNTSENIVVVDTMTSGLELIEDSIVVNVNDVDEDDYSDVSDQYENCTFAYEFEKKEKTETDEEGRILPRTGSITFKARVTADALVDTGRKNDADLYYGNYHTEDSVPFNLTKTGAYKFDGVTEAALEGAEFTLQTSDGDEITVKANADGIYYPSDADDASSTVVTNGEGLIIVRGLEAEKNYVLVETKAPENYNLPANVKDRTFALTLEEDTIVQATGVVVIANPTDLTMIANYKGMTLPATGGIGTTIFYIIGGLLIVAAAVFFVVRRKAE